MGLKNGIFGLKQGQDFENLPKFSHPPKKSQNQKFQIPQNPSIIPVTWNPEYPSPHWGYNGHPDKTDSS